MISTVNSSPVADGTLVVTGGGRGIGAAVSKAAAKRGFSVVVNYSQDAAGALRVVEDIGNAGGKAIAVAADVSVDADVRRLFDTAVSDLGPIVGLVNNAGVTGGFTRVDQLEAATVERVFAVNVVGAFLCAGEAVRRMSTRHGGAGGVIVNVSSRAAELGGAGEWVHYAATKGAIDSLTAGLGREVAAEGIRVNGVAAGLIETDLHAAAGKPTRTKDLATGIPMQRPGTANEVADAIIWLLSPESSYVTAATVAVAGGR
ncbi:SDR family oxidoreductase [Mycolicibacterium sp. 624]|uniref:SDR family oxidoreductase n=1 Tax=Mycolicibacterium sp. 624 TaxID=3156314 RepID=UPI003391500B